MNKKTYTFTLLILSTVFCSFFLYSQNTSSNIFSNSLLEVAKSINNTLEEKSRNINYSKQSDDLHSYKLENGFEIHILEDSENPLITVSFISKAGYSVQTQKNTGFPELAKNLFFKNSEIEPQNSLNLINLTSELKSDSVIFTGNCLLSDFENSINLISKAVMNPSFTDEVLSFEFTKLKNQSLENQKNELAYINSSIDSVIFASPWKQDTLLYEGLNEKYTIDEIRKEVDSIFKQFYTPNRSCIFVTGAVNHEEIFYLVKKYFNTWEKSIYSEILEKQSIKENTQKKYVLVSENFSKDYNQLIVQYPKEGLFSDIKNCGILQLASRTLENSANFKSKVCNEITSIYDESYIYSSFAENGSSSRIIIQSLMENRNVSPSIQAENLISTIDMGNVILENEFQNEKKKFLSQEISSRIDRKTLFEALVSTWAYGGIEYFYSYLENVKNLSLQDIQKTFQLEPFVFLLVHAETYNTYKESLKESGFVLLENNISFDLDFSKYPIQEEKEFTYLQSTFYKNNIESFKTYYLSNDISVVEKKSDLKESFTFHMIIKGGELFHYENPGLETITIKYLAKNIEKFFLEENPSANFFVNSDTEIGKSSITIVCSKNDVNLLLKSIEKALFYTDLTASVADELIFTENYNYRIDSSTSSSQLFFAGMENIFYGTVLENFFTVKDSLLTSINFTEVFKAYTELLDSKRFSFVCLGNIPENLLEMLEECFGSLKPINLVKNQENIMPIVSNATCFVQLKRIFTTDIKAEDAGPRPLKLIPTTVFTDPVDFYFETPENTLKEYEVFLALLEEFERILNENWKHQVEISVHNFASEKDIVKVQFKNVETKELSQIKEKFEKSLEQFISSVKNDCEKKLETYKNQYIVKYYQFENINQDTVKLIEKGMNQNKNYSQYLLNYEYIMNCKAEDFLNAINFFNDISVLEVRPSL